MARVTVHNARHIRRSCADVCTGHARRAARTPGAAGRSHADDSSAGAAVQRHRARRKGKPGRLPPQLWSCEPGLRGPEQQRRSLPNCVDHEAVHVGGCSAAARARQTRARRADSEIPARLSRSARNDGDGASPAHAHLRDGGPRRHFEQGTGYPRRHRSLSAPLHGGPAGHQILRRSPPGAARA
jgi:hypothetical protein